MALTIEGRLPYFLVVVFLSGGRQVAAGLEPSKALVLPDSYETPGQAEGQHCASFALGFWL